MLALKKRKVDESEQSRKCNDMHIHPAEQHRSDYMLDEAKENSEMILKSVAMKSVRYTNGYRSILAKKIEPVETSSSYKRLPRSCYHCSMLQLEPVIQIGDDEVKHSQKASFVTTDVDMRKPNSDKEKQKNFEETESSCSLKNNQRLSFIDKSHQPMILDLEDEKQYVHDSVGDSIKHGTEPFPLSFSATLAVKENDEGLSNFKSSKDVELSTKSRNRLLADESCGGAGISDIEFDSEMDCVLLDIPESSFVEKSSFFVKDTKLSKDHAFIGKEQSEFQSINDVPGKTSNMPNVLSNVADQCSTAIKNNRITPERSYMSVETIQRTEDQLLKQNVPIKSRTVTRDHMSKRSREMSFEAGSGIKNKSTTIKTPQFRPQPSINLDLDDDVIITKTVYKGKETVYRDDHTSQCSKYSDKTMTDGREVSTPLSKLTKSKDSLETLAQNNLLRVNTGFSSTTQKAANVKSSEDRKAEKDDRECPICLLKFPKGWTSSRKSVHLSECLTDDMFADENEHFDGQF